MKLRLLWFNLATDCDEPVLGFGTDWIARVASIVERVHVVTMRAGRFDLPANVTVTSVGKERGYSELRRGVNFYGHVSRLVLRREVDACVSHMIPVFSVLAGPLLRAARVPLVTWYAHPRCTLMLRMAHRVSDRMVTSLRTAYPYRGDKLRVIGQGIDTDLFTPGPSPLTPPRPRVLFVGRVSPVKNLQTLLQATARLRRRRARPFEVVVVGGPLGPVDRDHAIALRAEATRLGVDDIVHFAGAVKRQELRDWYRSARVHVNLTRLGSGDKVVLEAMACGVPSLIANDGFRETLDRHAPLLMFKPDDPEGLALRLDGLLELPPEQCQAIGRDLRARVEDLHGLDGWPQRLLRVVHEAMDRSPGTRPGDARRVRFQRDPMPQDPA